MSTVYEDIVKLVANNLKCSICFELFSEPVTLYCGHNYCLSCIQRHLASGKRNCPQCRRQLPAKPHLRKNVTLCTILDLQEAGGREMWNHVVTRTDQCFSDRRSEKMTEDVLVRRLEFLKLEIRRLETLQAGLNSGLQDGSFSARENVSTAEGFRSSPDREGGSGCADSSLPSLPSEPENGLNGLSYIEPPEGTLPDPDSRRQEVREALAGLSETWGASDSAAVAPNCSQPAEFAVLSFSPTLGNRRLAFVPESRRLMVSSSRSQVNLNSRFGACQWMADQEFSAGRHYWDVDVSRCSGWAAGVAHPDLGRNEKLGRGPSSWCIERSSRRLSAWHNSTETLVKQDCPDRVRVLLDMDSSCLSFWSLMDGQVELYSVQAGFRGPVRPVFWLFGTQQGNALTFPAKVSKQGS
ncbi:E3 ubiquitin-protein ligase RNF135 [Salminus brasiliensis]|uniref:E3 ubiquitin-protein ligase RNF135 n=1 Tax=Salminus brasiliensis TaxID=930266 RepID=UPI003B8354E2